MALDLNAQELLTRAKKIVGDKPELIDEAVRKVLQGTHDRARWIYLTNTLRQRLRASLRKLQNKNT